jgi:hypothetical protein
MLVVLIDPAFRSSRQNEGYRAILSKAGFSSPTLARDRAREMLHQINMPILYGHRHWLHLAFLFRPDLPPGVPPPAKRGATHHLLRSRSEACYSPLTMPITIST